MRLALATLLVLALPAIAAADVIEDSPCAEGWTWVRRGHGGACEPNVCTAETPCDGECVDVARCFRSQAMSQGDVPPGTPAVMYEAPLEALCGSDGRCAAGAHCVHQRECRPHQGMCTVSFARAPLPISLVLASTLALTRARRRRPDRSRAGRPGRS